VANGLPTIVAQWVSALDHTGHYREIEGFDDSRQVFISTDSYLGPNHEVSYAEFDQIWQRGNQRFMVIYPPAKEPLVNAVLASVGWNKQAAYQADLLKQQNPLPDAPQPAFFRPGDRLLGHAWDHIQLGDIATATAEIQQAGSAGANPLMLGWLKGAISSASS